MKLEYSPLNYDESPSAERKLFSCLCRHLPLFPWHFHLHLANADASSQGWDMFYIKDILCKVFMIIFPH